MTFSTDIAKTMGDDLARGISGGLAAPRRLVFHTTATATTAPPRRAAEFTIFGRDLDGNAISETIEAADCRVSARKVRRAFRAGSGRAARRGRARLGLYGRARVVSRFWHTTTLTFAGPVEVVFAAQDETGHDVPVAFGSTAS